MPVISGNIASNYTSVAYNIPAIIRSFSLANKVAGANTVTVGLLYGSTFDILYNEALNSGESYVYLGNDIILPTNNKIFISCGGSLDFTFSIFPYK